MRIVACSALALVLVLVLVPACSTYRDDLVRGQHAFDQNQHERALAVFRALEPDVDHLSAEERAHYAYLRGMTDYRIGYKADARHWLALAKALDEESPGLLSSDWKARLDEAMNELNAAVYTGGMASLTNVNKRRSEGEPRIEKAKAQDDARDEETEEEQPKPKKKKKPAEEE